MKILFNAPPSNIQYEPCESQLSAALEQAG
jgi:hypothetical protein